MDIYCLRIFIAECACKDIRGWISMWISTLGRLVSKNHEYPCWYPSIFGNPCMDLLWVLGPGNLYITLHVLGTFSRYVNRVRLTRLGLSNASWHASKMPRGPLRYASTRRAKPDAAKLSAAAVSGISSDKSCLRYPVLHSVRTALKVEVEKANLKNAV